MRIWVDSAKMKFGKLILECSSDEADNFLNKFKAGLFDITQASKKRSKDANSYCWVLCTAIATELKTTDRIIYRDAIRSVGVYEEYHILPEEVKGFRAAWGMLGIGWQTEQLDYAQDGNTVIIRAYRGSSTYDSKQMSRLIDWLVQEAEELEIETEDPAYINSLIERWESEYQYG